MNSLHIVIAAWLNASQRSRVGVGMNRSARSYGLDTALCENVHLIFYTAPLFLLQFSLL